MAYPEISVTLVGNNYSLIDVDGNSSDVISVVGLSSYDITMMNLISETNGLTFREKMTNHILPNGRKAIEVYSGNITTYQQFKTDFYKAYSNGDEHGQMSIRNKQNNTIAITTACSSDSLSNIIIGTNYVPITGFDPEVTDHGVEFIDGGLSVMVSGRYYFSGWASTRHSHNNATVGVLFVIKRDGVVVGNTPSSVPAKMPNIGDIGSIAGGGFATLEAGDVVIPYIASDIVGTVIVENCTIDAMIIKEG